MNATLLFGVHRGLARSTLPPPVRAQKRAKRAPVCRGLLFKHTLVCQQIRCEDTERYSEFNDSMPRLNPQ